MKASQHRTRHVGLIRSGEAAYGQLSPTFVHGRACYKKAKAATKPFHLFVLFKQGERHHCLLSSCHYFSVIVFNFSSTSSTDRFPSFSYQAPSTCDAYVPLCTSTVTRLASAPVLFVQRSTAVNCRFLRHYEDRMSLPGAVCRGRRFSTPASWPRWAQERWTTSSRKTTCAVVLTNPPS
ncbi:uncharacterized protein LOC119444674 [Dermacentor silvarum]|uniref:uncharacterized protein LOC119444674 n=1 Tax=Dermacentor silvarum TaxID=543639 RepID=UPI001896AF63|nr:uncharacterized protein LOC119444674 [Dermacentor silvarum]